MQTGAITQHIDVAQLALYMFWIFFAALIIHIRNEDRREGWPLVSDMPGRVPVSAAIMPKAKIFLRADGTQVPAPRVELDPPSNSVPSGNFPGAPFTPVGNPMLAAVGPGSYVQRADVPERMVETGEPTIVPLRVAHEFSIPKEDPDIRGFDVVGADNVVGGSVVDVWVDRSETILRYIELRVAGQGASKGAGRIVLVPMTFATISSSKKQVKVRAILGAQFADAPVLAQPDQITKLEEDRVCGYYGGGTLYATPQRLEPIL
jgi:photosynthetic reaction center H subunit